MSELKFRVSSALKSIIGSELITDDFIAVFELVKNSFDAGASQVDITFDVKEQASACIVIRDDGNGMNHDDLTNKWLFVAYSEKREPKDYRDHIAIARIYAGAKGIGRFSCDRLGRKLTLYSRKRGSDGPWHVLTIRWDLFEQDAEMEFQSIPAEYSTQGHIPYSGEHGTILEISDLRSDDWQRPKLLRLRRSMERLVNPNQENDAQNFQIILHAPQEADNDKVIEQKATDSGEPAAVWDIVNGPIRNFLFEALELKTAQVVVEVDETGSTIRTRLEDRSTLIYDIVETSPFQNELSGIKIHLFALNRSARLVFTKRMGIRPHIYGSVFLYKNGFRIHPYGDPDDDSLGVDARHQQGVWRTLGTRDLSGRIEINGSNPDLKETSSRDGGLIRNAAFHALRTLFTDYALKRLEKFVIDLAKFGPERGELPDLSVLAKSEVKDAIFDIVGKLAQSKEIVSLHYDPDFLNILDSKSPSSVSNLLRQLRRIPAAQSSPELAREVEKAERRYAELLAAKREAEEAEARERDRARQAEKMAREAEERTREAEEHAKRAEAKASAAEEREENLDTQNVFLKSVLSKDLEHVLALHHSIIQDAQTIELHVNHLLSSVRRNPAVPPKDLRRLLERISYVVKKIMAVSRFATHANVRSAKQELTSDLIEYLREYLLNVYGGEVLDPYGNPIKIRFHQPARTSFISRFAPTDVSIVLDNLISNARKHEAHNIDVWVEPHIPEDDDGQLICRFRNDGSIIPEDMIPRLFEMGFTTTSGSGLGLHHIREILTKMGGTIWVTPNLENGAEFVFKVPKR